MKPKHRATEIDSVIGHNIRLVRNNKGLTQSELAGHIGVSFQQLQKYERGTNRISAANLLRIAHATDIPLESFFNAPQVEQRYTITIDKDLYKIFRLFQDIPDQYTKEQLKLILKTIASENDKTQES